MASASLPFFPAFSSVCSAYLSSVLSTRPRQFLYSLSNESNAQTEGPPTPLSRLDFSSFFILSAWQALSIPLLPSYWPLNSLLDQSGVLVKQCNTALQS